MLKTVFSMVVLGASAGAALAHPGSHDQFSLTEMFLHMAGSEHFGFALLGGVVTALMIWTLRAMRGDRKL